MPAMIRSMLSLTLWCCAPALLDVLRVDVAIPLRCRLLRRCRAASECKMITRDTMSARVRLMFRCLLFFINIFDYSRCWLITLIFSSLMPVYSFTRLFFSIRYCSWFSDAAMPAWLMIIFVVRYWLLVWRDALLFYDCSLRWLMLIDADAFHAARWYYARCHWYFRCWLFRWCLYADIDTRRFCLITPDAADAMPPCHMLIIYAMRRDDFDDARLCFADYFIRLRILITMPPDYLFSIFDASFRSDVDDYDDAYYLCYDALCLRHFFDAPISLLMMLSLRLIIRFVSMPIFDAFSSRAMMLSSR